MNRLSKAILITVGSLLALAVVFLLCVNLYVQSPGTQARVQEALGKALKMPLTITSTTVSPWGELKVNGITVPSGNGNFLEAPMITARYSLSSLFGGRLLLADVRIDQPKIVWIQAADGSWSLPSLPKPAANPEATPKPEKKKTEKSFEVIVDGLALTGATVEFIDKEQKRLALLSGVEVRCKTVSEAGAEGTAAIQRAGYGDKIAIDGLHSPFKFSNGILEFPALDGTLAGGALTGSFQIEPKPKKAPFSIDLKFQNVDAGKMTEEAGWLPGQASGRLQGSLQLKGSAREIRRCEGKGNLALAEGQFRQLDLFEAIGQFLQLEELSNLKLASATADFRVGDEKATIDSLLLEAADLRISAKGTARFDEKLNMDALLGLRPSLAKKMPGFVRDTLTETDSAGFPAVAFKISGKTQQPKTDLGEKLVGKKLGDQLENLVTGLFGTKKKKDPEDDSKKKKKKKKDEGTPDAEKNAPQPAVAPQSSPAGETPASVPASLPESGSSPRANP